MATQAERKAATRQVLLDAAADVLVDAGLSGFTTAAVTDSAEMSNGALFGHFPTRRDLIAATLEHVLVRLRNDYDRTFSGLITVGPTDVTPEPETALQLLWAAMSDPQFRAVLEIYTTARTDRDLADAISPIVEEHSNYLTWLIDRVASAIAIDASLVAPLADIGNLAVLTMQGLAVRHTTVPAGYADNQIIDTFASIVRALNQSPQKRDQT